MCCCLKENLITIKTYNPTPKNPDGSIRWFLYRWDDGKKGERRLVRCRVCGALYLVQAYRLHKFSRQHDTVFEDHYAVRDEQQADHFNRIYTGTQLEHAQRSVFSFHSL